MSHGSSSDRQNSSFSSVVDDAMNSRSMSRGLIESKGKERTKTRPGSSSRPRGRSRNRSGTPSSSRSKSRSSSRSKSRSSSRSKSRSSSRSTKRKGSKSKKKTPTPSSTSNNSGNPKHTRVQPEQEILEQNGIDLKSLSLKAAEELSNRPKKGVIYDEVKANLRSIEIKKRLKQLSMNNQTFSIDEAAEIADAACLLRLSRKPKHEIELAGQMAHSGALLMLQADMLAKKGRELLDQSKRKLESAEL